jgi:hypothetical protein
VVLPQRHVPSGSPVLHVVPYLGYGRCQRVVGETYTATGVGSTAACGSCRGRQLHGAPAERSSRPASSSEPLARSWIPGRRVGVSELDSPTSRPGGPVPTLRRVARGSGRQWNRRTQRRFFDGTDQGRAEAGLSGPGSTHSSGPPPAQGWVAGRRGRAAPRAKNSPGALVLGGPQARLHRSPLAALSRKTVALRM